MLKSCLASLAVQKAPQNCLLHVVVVDNGPQPSAQPLVEAMAGRSAIPFHYLHEPVRGIARARNAVLDKATALGANWIAMLDDDETAAPDWIEHLMAAEYRAHPGTVRPSHLGVSGARPFWAPDKEARLPKEGSVAKHGSTGNVRFSAAVIHAGLRFDESMGLAGGSDQRFFSAAMLCGFAIHVTNRAITYETVHPERLTYRFMVRRHYAHAASQTSHKVKARGYAALMEDAPKRLLDVPLGLLELVISIPAAAFGFRHFKKFALRGGKRFAQVAGHLVLAAGHLPQPYRDVVGD